MKLDENERSTQTRLMKVKDMMLEQTHHYREKNEEKYAAGWSPAGRAAGAFDQKAPAVFCAAEKTALGKRSFLFQF